MSQHSFRKSRVAIGLLATPSHASQPRSPQTVKARQLALHDLASSILVGPPTFPIKHSTAAALFDLALDRLARHDKTAAQALRHYSSMYARLEFLDYKTSTSGQSLVGTCIAVLGWFLNPTEYTADDIRNKFDVYRKAVGKKTCHNRTIRRQHELLRAYGRAHNYPVGALSQRAQRSAWVHVHLSAMITEAQVVSCWHSQHDLTKQDLDEVLKDIHEKTSLTELSILVLALLHSTTPDYLSKRLLPHRRQ